MHIVHSAYCANWTYLFAYCMRTPLCPRAIHIMLKKSSLWVFCNIKILKICWIWHKMENMLNMQNMTTLHLLLNIHCGQWWVLLVIVYSYHEQRETWMMNCRQIVKVELEPSWKLGLSTEAWGSMRYTTGRRRLVRTRISRLIILIFVIWMFAPCKKIIFKAKMQVMIENNYEEYALYAKYGNVCDIQNTTDLQDMTDMSSMI